MIRRKCLCSTLVFIFTISLPLFSQDDEIFWVPLNVPQLTETEITWLDTLTENPYSARYSEALGFIRDKVFEGQISAADKASVQILKRIGLSPYSVIQSGSRTAAATVEVRQQAIRLLGYIGGEYSLQAVDELLGEETDSSVLSAVFFVYSEIAPPFNEKRSAEFTRILRGANQYSADNYLVRQILYAINSMHRRTFSMTSSELFEQILSVAKNGHSSALRNQALELARFIAGVEINTEVD